MAEDSVEPSASSSSSGLPAPGPNPEAALAVALMSQDWRTIGLDASDPTTAATSDPELIIDRITALLTVRLAAVAAPLGTYPDLSVLSIGRHLLRTGEQGWPASMTPTVLKQLREWVRRILHGYRNNHYHNQEHACHVTLSACKLLDMMLHVPPSSHHGRLPPSFGLRNDPLRLFAVLFSALIHDVEHQGLPNRQLSQEKDRLAILYNDQSIAENWSLYIAFSEFLQDDLADLRQVLLGGPADARLTHNHEEGYHTFRQQVITLVLATDIASPERTQIHKSKWKEAFGDPYETVERKVRRELRRASIGMTGKVIVGRHRRESMLSQVSRPSQTHETGDTEASMLPRDANDDLEDDSLSLTPEHSVHEQEDDDDDEHFVEADDGAPGPTPVAPTHATRKASMGYGPGAPSRFERRMSASAMSRSSRQSAKYRQRLGIRRSMDLSGETIEAYPRSASMGNMSGHAGSGAATVYSLDLDADQPDDLKATVVMEVILMASDVAHNLQGFEQMKKWSNKLYLELRQAYVAKRGVDCSPKWFENQIGFLESYLLPLARKLEDTGVFGEDPQFAANVEHNRDTWLTRGMEIADQIVKEGRELYPEPTL